jgi:predicted CoA-binding protein
VSDWKANLVEDTAGIAAIVKASKVVAVLGIKTEEQSDQPAYYVPEYLHSAGVKIIPVPVYYPDVTEILGEKVHRTLAAIPGPVDLVDVFRRPADVAKHLDDLLAKKPKAVWMQSGIRNDAVAETLAKAGIQVVQDRCLMVEHRRSR